MANSVRMQVQLSGFDEFRVLMAELPASVEARVLSDAISHAVKPIVARAKALAPRKTGALQRSLTSVVRRYPGKGKIVAVIGPDKDYYSGGKRMRRGESRKGADRPAKYAHLVEFGHFSGTHSGQFGGFKKGTSLRQGNATAASFVGPKPFLRPAVAAGEREAATRLADGVEIGMAREIKRLAGKMRRLQRQG